MSEWYIRLFNPDYLRSTTQIEALAEEQARQAAALLNLERGASVLDLAGGYGRVAVPLAKRGLCVTVLDLSDDMLKIGRERAAAAEVELTWIRADMREVPPAPQHDAVISMFSSFGYFARDDENEKALHAACRALRPGGLFLLDAINRELVVRGSPASLWAEAPDAVTLDQSTFDLATGRAHTQRVFHDLRSGERREYSFDVRIYTAPEYRNMLERAGCSEVLFFGGLERSALTPESRRIVVLARKGV
jgi:ubiquinone/menaquinone biosynthesis C-methylase UbiE